MRTTAAAWKGLVAILCTAGATAALAYVPDRQIPVRLIARSRPGGCAVGQSIPVALVIENGLSDEIGFTAFSLEPNDWNGETYSCSLVDIYRDGKPGNLYLARPAVDAPDTISGPAVHYIKPGESLAIELDLSKWSLRDGWLKGTYQATLRADAIIADKYVTLSVRSDPVTFEIR